MRPLRAPLGFLAPLQPQQIGVFRPVFMDDEGVLYAVGFDGLRMPQKIRPAEVTFAKFRLPYEEGKVVVAVGNDLLRWAPGHKSLGFTFCFSTLGHTDSSIGNALLLHAEEADQYLRDAWRTFENLEGGSEAHGIPFQEILDSFARARKTSSKTTKKQVDSQPVVVGFAGGPVGSEELEFRHPVVRRGSLCFLDGETLTAGALKALATRGKVTLFTTEVAYFGEDARFLVVGSSLDQMARKHGFYGYAAQSTTRWLAYFTLLGKDAAMLVGDIHDHLPLGPMKDRAAYRLHDTDLPRIPVWLQDMVSMETTRTTEMVKKLLDVLLQAPEMKSKQKADIEALLSSLGPGTN